MPQALTLRGGRILRPDGTLAHGGLRMAGGAIAALSANPIVMGDRVWDAKGMLILPGMVDLHGDAFERCLMPRPGVRFETASALFEADRQMVAAGITTAFHGVTCSWEPGLRGLEQADDLVRTVAALRGRLSCDTRLHLRHEIANLDGEERLSGWIKDGLIGLLAFNDHLDGIEDELLEKPHKAAAYVGRTGLSQTALLDRIEALQAQRPEMAQAVERLANLARVHGLAMASHDDETPEDRRAMHGRGVGLCEFPVDAATARAARALGDAVILGAPNIMRGGSHCDRLNAAEAVAEGLCTVLASDYHYPSLLGAVFRLAKDDVAFLPDAWNLVAANPAEAVGLDDRGRLEPGRRADVIVVDDSGPFGPRVAASFVAGRCVYASMDPVEALQSVPTLVAV
jgi:alpha-D-ribose 1-methylphosphonate 5-triphosphate diphosphatase